MIDKKTMNPTPHLALIGAGIAGLSCATALQRAGLEVSLFDKSRGPGGRMRSRRDDDWQCDHGAQYFTARHPAFRAEVARWQQAGVAGVWEPRRWMFAGDSSQGRESTVARFVGVPAMTAPARYLANTVAVHALTTIEQLRRQRHGWQSFSTEQGWLETCLAAVLLAVLAVVRTRAFPSGARLGLPAASTPLAATPGQQPSPENRMSPGTTLRLILGDQLNPQHTWFEQQRDDVLYVFMEMRQETDYVLHHAQKIIAIFAAMRELARQLRAAGHCVHYLAIDDPDNRQALPDNLDALMLRFNIRACEYQAPDEWRLDAQLADYGRRQSIPGRMVDSEHFYTLILEFTTRFEQQRQR